MYNKNINKNTILISMTENKKIIKVRYKNFLDLRKIQCPDTIVFLRKKIRIMQPKELVLILSNDISTKRDIPTFCHFMDHFLIEYYIDNKPYKYLLQKKAT